MGRPDVTFPKQGYVQAVSNSKLNGAERFKGSNPCDFLVRHLRLKITEYIVS